MKVTADMLRGLDACEEQVAIVEREGPRGVPITTPSIRKAYRLGLDVEGVCSKGLSASALAECKEVSVPAGGGDEG